MARTADKPGQYRITPKRGAFMLSGVRANGNRVKIAGLTRDEAQQTADRLFANHSAINPDGLKTAIDSVGLPPLDDYGLPLLKVSPTIAAAMAPPPQSNTKSSDSIIKPADTPEKKELRAKQAKSLMELAGVVWASGDVWIGRKLTERAGCEPVMPNAKQVNDLREVTKETLTDLFGDTEIKSWQMMFLLSIAIPASMLIQSPRKPKPKEETSPANQTDERPLRSV